MKAKPPEKLCMLNLLVAIEVMTFWPSDKIATWYHIVLTAFKGIDVRSPTTIILTNSSGATASESKSSVLVNIVMGRVYTLWIENHEIYQWTLENILILPDSTSLQWLWNLAFVCVAVVAVVVIVCEGYIAVFLLLLCFCYS